MHNFSATKKRLLLFVLFGWLLLLVGDRVGELRQYQGSFVAMYTLAIASIILLTGYSGQLSLGHSALMAVGAYAGALSTNNAHLHPVIALIIATFEESNLNDLLCLPAAPYTYLNNDHVVLKSLSRYQCFFLLLQA